MQLTNFSDYTLRVLMYAAAQGDRLITIEETAGVYHISRAHLMKVVNQLTRAGYLKAVRGRSGGLRLPNGQNASISVMSCARRSPILHWSSALPIAIAAC